MEAQQIVIDQLKSMATGAIETLPQIVAAVIILIITWLVARLVRKLVVKLTGSRLRPSLKRLFVNFAGIGVWLLGLMISAIVVFPNLTPANLIAGLGIGSVAIGFAFKDVFENFLAGVIILFRREMRIGDFVECQDIEGKVEEISIRETHIRQSDGQLVVVPNGLLFKNPVVIRTDEERRRCTVICGVGYSENVDDARAVIEQAVAACDTVITDDKPIQVFAQEFNSSSIDFEVTWWTGSQPVDIRRSRDQVIAAVKHALDEAGVEIPFPYRTLTFSEPLHVAQEASAD